MGPRIAASLRAGAAATGVAAALTVWPATAMADDGGRGSAGSKADSSVDSHARGPARAPRPAAAARNSVVPQVSPQRDRTVTRAAVVPPPAVVNAPTAPVPAAVAPAVPTASTISPVAPSVGAVGPAPTAVASDPGPIRAAVLAAQSYLYGYPLMEYQRVRQTFGTVNTFKSLTSFASPDVDPIWEAIGGGRRPNVDTFYSLAELDLSKGPVVLSVPDMGSRYFSFQLTDPYTNVANYIGSRATGPGPGKYAITWAGGPHVDVPDAQTVEVPYASMLALGRTLAGDPADQLKAIELIKQYTLTPGGGTVSPVIPIPEPGLGYLDAISAAMELNPPPAVDAPQLAAMAQIGVGPGLRVSDAHLGLLSRVAADLAVKATAALLPLLTTLTQFTSAVQNRGWASPDSAIGNYGTDYLLRAGVTQAGLLANTPEEAVYKAGLLDSRLLVLGGLGFGSYTLHFAPGQEPPVDAFWSVTVYDSGGKLVANPTNRYSVSSSRPEELVRRPDGSVDIVFSPCDPADPGANWLKVPRFGGFNAYLRMYVPGQAVLDGSWQPPAIVHHW
jgi:hypothetical protein